VSIQKAIWVRLQTIHQWESFDTEVEGDWIMKNKMMSMHLFWCERSKDIWERNKKWKYDKI